MLKQRVITASILGIFVLLAVLLFSDFWFALLTAVLVLLAGWEWANLSGLTQLPQRVIYLIVLAAALWLSWYLPLGLIILIACVWWLCALYFVIKYPAKQELWRGVTTRAGIGLLVLAPFWLAMNNIRSQPHGPALLLFCFFLVWAADIGAYFAGRYFGRTKLMPAVSPGKTWEGFLGGLILSMLVASIVSVEIDMHFKAWFLLMLFVVLLNIYAVVGDLSESMLKRYCQIKDSGNMLPGHGGLMDRIDSLTAATPLFLLGLFGYWYF